MRVLASKGHDCLYEPRGEPCPGPAGCTTAGAEVTDNPCDKGGVRDELRALARALREQGRRVR